MGPQPGSATEGAQTVRRALAPLRLVATGQELGVRLAAISIGAMADRLQRKRSAEVLAQMHQQSAMATRRLQTGPAGAGASSAAIAPLPR